MFLCVGMTNVLVGLQLVSADSVRVADMLNMLQHMEHMNCSKCKPVKTVRDTYFASLVHCKSGMNGVQWCVTNLIQIHTSAHCKCHTATILLSIVFFC